MWGSVWIWLALICVALSAIAYLVQRNVGLCPPCRPLQLLQKLCPPQPAAFQMMGTDADERLDRLAKALAEKESRCYLSKSKIKCTKQQMEQLGEDKQQYRSVLGGLRKELTGAEAECRRIREQIEWVALKRAELLDEVQLSHRMYGRAATELASNVADLQRGRLLCRPLPQGSRPGPISYNSYKSDVVGCSRCKTE